MEKQDTTSTAIRTNLLVVALYTLALTAFHWNAGFTGIAGFSHAVTMSLAVLVHTVANVIVFIARTAKQSPDARAYKVSIYVTFLGGALALVGTSAMLVKVYSNREAHIRESLPSLGSPDESR